MFDALGRVISTPQSSKVDARIREVARRIGLAKLRIPVETVTDIKGAKFKATLGDKTAAENCCVVIKPWSKGEYQVWGEIGVGNSPKVARLNLLEQLRTAKSVDVYPPRIYKPSRRIDLKG